MKISFAAQININQLNNTNDKNTVFASFVQQKTLNNSNDSFYKTHDVLQIALNNLKELKFSKRDIKQLEKYGARIIFNSGQEALEFAKQENIPIVFGKIDQPDVHAQWINSKKIVVINDKYKNTTDVAEIYAISAAIMHELSHAKDNDGISSIQEEIDCLGMNAIAFNVYKEKYKNIFKDKTSPIIQDGVDLYTKLFFHNDKQSLLKRIKLKYGNLLIESPNHPASDFAKEISNHKN